MIDIFNQLTNIISIQNGIIDDMFMVLLQHVPTDDDSMKQIMTEMEGAAALRHEFEHDVSDDDYPLPF